MALLQQSSDSSPFIRPTRHGLYGTITVRAKIIPNLVRISIVTFPPRLRFLDVELGPWGPSRATCNRLEVPEAVALPAQVSDDAFIIALQYSRPGLRRLNGPSIDRSLAALPTNTPTREPAEGCGQVSTRDNSVSSTADATTPTIADIEKGLSTKPSTSPCNNK